MYVCVCVRACRHVCVRAAVNCNPGRRWIRAPCSTIFWLTRWTPPARGQSYFLRQLAVGAFIRRQTGSSDFQPLASVGNQIQEVFHRLSGKLPVFGVDGCSGPRLFAALMFLAEWWRLLETWRYPTLFEVLTAGDDGRHKERLCFFSVIAVWCFYFLLSDTPTHHPDKRHVGESWA